MRSIRIALIQMAAQDAKPIDEIIANAESQIVAAATGADLVVLPEIWVPGYFDFDRYREASDVADAVKKSMADAAVRAGVHLHAGSIVERDGDRLFNTSVLFDPGGNELATYRKIHLFGYGSREQELLTPGTKPCVVDTNLGRMGMAVCYDLRYPELFREMADAGAEIVLVASAWPHPRVDAWNSLLQVRALENQLFVAAANGTGRASGGALLGGRSAVIDPWGTRMAAAGDAPAVVTATVDLDEVDEARRVFPQLADRVLLEPPEPTLFLRRDGQAPLRFPVEAVLLGGFTGTDVEAVKSYIAKLEKDGIAAPPNVPMFYDVGADRVTTRRQIDVLGDRSCGEVEVALLVGPDETYLTVASDHTDRELEAYSIPHSKQATPKVLADEVWRLEDVLGHWDQLTITAFTPASSTEPYQHTSLDSLLDPVDLLDHARDQRGSIAPHTIVFGGTVGTLGDGFRFESSFRAVLADPVLDRSITLAYDTRTMGGTP